MNESHLEVLKRSVEEWNKWREENWNIKPDLSGGDLSGLNMIGANLDDVNFASTDLRGAVMINCTARHADFEHANLEKAKLQGADFTSANFTRASLRDCNATGTVFKNAILMEADLTGANCTAAHFENANLLNAFFYNAQVKGANFEGTNIHEANLYSDQFVDANIPLEVVGGVEQKQKTGIQYAILFVTFGLVLFTIFLVYVLIFQSEDIGKPTTKIRSAIYLRLAGMFDSFDNFEKALHYYNLSKKYNPNSAEVYYQLGSLYRRHKMVAEAIENYEKFVKMAPQDKRTGNIKVYIYQFKGKIKRKKKKKSN